MQIALEDKGHWLIPIAHFVFRWALKGFNSNENKQEKIVVPPDTYYINACTKFKKITRLFLRYQAKLDFAY